MKRALHWAVIVGVVLQLMTQLNLSLHPLLFLLLYLVILFVVCLNCAGRLISNRPKEEHHLTTFYLVLALGGLAGSLFVSWLLPRISYYPVEFLIALLLSIPAVLPGKLWPPWQHTSFSRRTLFGLPLICLTVLVLLPWWFGQSMDLNKSHEASLLLLAVAVPVCLSLLKASESKSAQFLTLLAVVTGISWTAQLASGASGVKRHRNYYGIYRVFERGPIRYLQHGTTQHGRQYIEGDQQQVPLSYYHPTTPAAEILQSDLFELEHVGMIGLGAGALATYTGEGQRFTVFELDEDNIPIAEENFTYLEDARQKGSDVRFVIGDGRIAVRDLDPGSLNVLLVDAFNSGSIPVHLMTVEAFDEYLHALGEDGLLVLHISNKILDLLPVVTANALSLGYPACFKSNEANLHEDADITLWFAVSRNPAVIERLVSDLGWQPATGDRTPLPPSWTDQFSNILRALL